MALALYRKYRPKSFAELIGQDHVTGPLMQALRTGRLNHAYLFSGPRGCGKTSSARILARSLNCEQGPTPEPCGECESCRALAPDGPGSIDVIEIDAASHGGVDDARDLRERAFFAPAVSRFKIYIIDEAHMVSSAGFNALLKLVEEPPDFVKFVFATTEPEKVLGTIKSRTHHYPFRLIPPGVLRPYLEQLCVREDVKVDPAVFPLVVRAGGGSARDSLSVLDQLIAGAGDEGVTYAGAVALLGVTDATLIDEICDALAADDGAGAFGAIDRVAEAGLDPRRFAGDLLERLRDLILLRQVPDAASKGLIDAPADQLERMQGHAARLGPATLSRWADIVHNGLVEMRGTTSPRLLLELITARMLLPAADTSSAAMLSRLERLERGAPLTAGPARSQSAAAPGVGEPVPTGPAATGASGGGREAARAAASAAAHGGPVKPTSPAPAADRAVPTAEAAPPASGSPVQAPPAEAPNVSAAASGPTTDSRSADTEATATDHPGAPGQQAEAALAAPRPAAVEPEPQPAAAAAQPAEAPQAASAGGKRLDAVGVRQAWRDEIMPLLSRSHKRVAAMAVDAVVREVEGDTLVLVFAHAFHLNSIAKDPTVLLSAVSEVLGGTWKLRCELGGDQRQAEPAADKPRAATAPAPASAPPPAPIPEPAAPVGADGWPTPAALGGSGASSEASIAAAPAGTGKGAAPTVAGKNAAAPAGAAPRAIPAPTGNSGRDAARQAAAGGGTKTATRPAKAAASRDDGPPPGEPPYDPEFDGPPPKSAYDGFAPGDEPTDEVIDPAVARRNSQQQAVDVVKQAFRGAETIGEVEAR